MEKDNLINSKVSHEPVLNGRQQTILDLFRIIAAAFVMVGHSFSFYHCTVFRDQTYFPYLQNIGVVLFFLLSGFLTAFSLEKKNNNHQYTFLKFASHKAFRILKEYIPGLLIIAVIDAISILINGDKYPYYEAYNIKQFIGNALMLHNMGPNSILGRYFIPFGSGRPLWTLAVEWWLYMLFGALFLSLSNKVKVSLPKIFVFGFILFMSSDYLITGRGAGLGFVFALGVLAYYAYELIEQKTAIFVFISSCLLYVMYGFIYKEVYTVYSFIILGVIFSSAIKIGGGTPQDRRRNRILAFISRSTFMLYLIHYSIIDMFVHYDVSWSLQVKFLIGIILSMIVSLLGYYVFGEKDLVGYIINCISKNRK